MAEVTNELIYEVLKKLQADVAGLKDVWVENTAALNAIRTHMIGSQDIQNIYSVLARHDAPLARIESRLEIVEPV
jgi:hypothetical protein